MQQVIAIVIVILLILQRINRSIGFQPYKPTTLVIRMAAFAFIGLAMLSSGFTRPSALMADGAGIVTGLVLAYIATNHAQFEKREDKLYFKTHIWMELAVIVLFVARVAYRVFVLKNMLQPNNAESFQARIDYLRDPFSAFTLTVFSAYYIGYFAFILKEGRKQL